MQAQKAKPDKFSMPINPFIQEFVYNDFGKLFYIATPDSVLIDADTLLVSYEVGEWDFTGKGFKPDWSSDEFVMDYLHETILWNQFDEWQENDWKISAMNGDLFDFLSKFVKFIRLAHKGLNRFQFISSTDNDEFMVVLDINWNGN